MRQAVVPMLSVADLRASAEWYVSIGFTLTETNEDEAVTDWAEPTFGGSAVMLNAGGGARPGERRDSSLYIMVDDVAAWRGRVDDRDVIAELNGTFYGHRIFVLRDPDGFPIVFAQSLQSPA